MRKNLMFLALAAIGLASCNGGYKQGDGGMLYKLLVDKSGPKIQVGDFIVYNIIVKNEADSVIFNSYYAEQPQPVIVLKPEYKGDLFDAMKLLTEGDSASIKLPVDSMYKKRPKPPTLKGKYLVCTLKIEKLISKGKMTDQALQSAASKYFTSYIMQLNFTLRKAEAATIKNYIADKKLNVTKTDSGLYYVITKTGTGPVAMKGDTVLINYTGSLLNGTVFDSNIKDDVIKAKLSNNLSHQYAPLRFPLGEKKVIAGWDQGIQLLNKGAKATFITSSHLAYGGRGIGPIPPFSPVAFDIELVNIIHPDPNAPKPAAAAGQPAINGAKLSM